MTPEEQDIYDVTMGLKLLVGVMDRGIGTSLPDSPISNLYKQRRLRYLDLLGRYGVPLKDVYPKGDPMAPEAMGRRG